MERRTTSNILRFSLLPALLSVSATVATVVFLAVVLVLFAGAIEFAQIFTLGRHARLSDFFVDALAACVGVALSALVTDFAKARPSDRKKDHGSNTVVMDIAY